MVSSEEAFDQYFVKRNAETFEGAADHPAGMIAQYITQMHPNEENVSDYEYKVSN